MPTTYRATLTNVGAALVADAIAQGTTLTWAKMALGDGNGSAVIVDAGRTSLVNERYRAPLNDLGRDSANPNTIVGTLVVPPETGGWTIREFGIYDNASTPRLVAYGETPEIEKPASSAGTGINLRLRFKLVVSADANITLSPDSNEAYATIEYVKDNAVKSLSVSGRTITYTMGDGDTHTLQTQDTTYSDATQSVHGLMSTADKKKVDDLADWSQVDRNGRAAAALIGFANPAVRALDKSGHVTIVGGSDTGATSGAKLILNGAERETDPGVFCLQAGTGTGYKQLIGKSDGSLTWNNKSLINQNAFSNVKVGNSTIEADDVTDTLELAAGTGISLTVSTTNDKVTIAGKTASTSETGLMSASDKSKLDNVYVGQVIPANSDLNDYQTPGIYYCSSNNNVATLKNCPSNVGFTLFVLSSLCTQIVVSYSGAIYKRYYQSWSPVKWFDWILVGPYSHPTTAGNKHIPSGGAANQYLKYSASGTAVWGDAVTLDTSQEITANKYFTQFLYPKIANVQNGTSPSANQFQSLRFVDKNNANLGQLQMAYRTSGQRDLGLWLYDENGIGHYPITLICSADGTTQALANVTPANDANDNQIVPTKWIRNITGIAGGLEGIVAKSIDSNNTSGHSSYIKYSSGIVLIWGSASFTTNTYIDITKKIPCSTLAAFGIDGEAGSVTSASSTLHQVKWGRADSTNTTERFVTNTANTAFFAYLIIGKA